MQTCAIRISSVLAAIMLGATVYAQDPFERLAVVSGDFAGLPDQTAPLGPLFGYSVAIGGSWMAVGAPATITDAGGSLKGAVFLFRNQGDDWELVQRIEPIGTASVGSAVLCGHSVALAGSHLVIGCPGLGEVGNPDSERGMTLVYQRISVDEWGIKSAFFGSAGERCGAAVSIALTPIVIPARATAVSGCPGYNQSQGKVQVYSFDGSDWSFNTTITSSDGVGGDLFGRAVALHRSCGFIPAPTCLTRLAVGAPGKAHGTLLAVGSAYVFDGGWNETDIFTPFTAPWHAATLYGIDVDINRDQLIIGSSHGLAGSCPGSPSWPRCGRIDHFEFDSGSWSYSNGGGAINDGGSPPGQERDMAFGQAVALGFDNWIAIAAPFTDGPDGQSGTWDNLGMVELRRDVSGGWGVGSSSYRGELRPSGPSSINRAGSLFGNSLDFDNGRWLAVGIPRTRVATGSSAPRFGEVWMYVRSDGIFADRFEE
jgi:hypothetical protein